MFFRLVKCAVEVFQSTPPHGRRLYCLCNLVFLPNVSIHASAREATLHTMIMSREIPCFNPRLRTGGDCFQRISLSGSGSFNPRLRTGGDYIYII